MCTVNAQQPLCPLVLDRIPFLVLRDAHLYAPRGAAHQVWTRSRLSLPTLEVPESTDSD